MRPEPVEDSEFEAGKRDPDFASWSKSRDLLEDRCHQHDERNVQREASRRAVLVHAPYLVAIGRHRRGDDEERRDMVDHPLDGIHDAVEVSGYAH